MRIDVDLENKINEFFRQRKNYSKSRKTICVRDKLINLEMRFKMKKKKYEITIRSSAAEYLTFVASTGDSKEQY